MPRAGQPPSSDESDVLTPDQPPVHAEGKEQPKEGVQAVSSQHAQPSKDVPIPDQSNNSKGIQAREERPRSTQGKGGRGGRKGGLGFGGGFKRGPR